MKLFLSFVVGGGLVAFATWCAERYGPEVGGMLAGLPTTVLVSLLFIALTSSAENAVRATDVVPAALSVSGLFLMIWSVVAMRGLRFGYAAAFAVWFIGALGIRTLSPEFFDSLLIFLVLFLVSFVVLERVLHLPRSVGSKIHFSLPQIFLRAVFSGFIIATAVCLSRLSGPLLGGVFAVFPASYFSTLLIAERQRGRDFALSLVRPLLSSGMINCLVYICVVRLTYVKLGIFPGTALALTAALLTAYGLFCLRRQRVA